MDLHGLAEARSLADHRAVAELLESRPDRAGPICERARDRAGRLANSGQRSAPYGRDWLALLALPWPQLAAAMLDPTAQGLARRQATPFAGALARARVGASGRKSGKAGATDEPRAARAADSRCSDYRR